MRDRAVDGLVSLSFREKWRNSPEGEQIVALIAESLSDDNAVVRMTSARAFGIVHLHESAEERIRLLGEILSGEPDRQVRNVYLNLLGSEAHQSPEGVDAVLRTLMTDRPKLVSVGDDDDDDDDDDDGIPVEMLTFLAVQHQTPFAVSVVRAWVSDAPLARQARRVTSFVRDYLAPAADSAVQARAFETIALAAESSLKHWQEHSSASELADEELEKLKRALSILDNVASQLYFASGAFDEKRDGEAKTPSRPSQERFAELATPILIDCARCKVAGVVHHVVETLIFLSPLDEGRGLGSIAEAVAADGTYAYDTMSGDLVIPYLKRLLAEHRNLVLFDDHGVVAFRKLLSAFASAGNESALELAFTFSDAFR